MTNRNKVHSALKKTVFPCLLEQGFEGKYPHFRRYNGDALELISFATEKSGGAFGISVSVAFPTRKHTNLIWSEQESDITAFSTRERYPIPGMFGGMFYYGDVYQKQAKHGWFQVCTHYRTALNQKTAEECLADGFVRVFRFQEDTPAQICDMAIRQLEEGFMWMKKFEKKHR